MYVYQVHKKLLSVFSALDIGLVGAMQRYGFADSLQNLIQTHAWNRCSGSSITTHIY